MDLFSFISLIIGGGGFLLSLYMFITAHFPDNLFFSRRGYRLRQSTVETSGTWVRISGGLWIIASAVRLLSHFSSQPDLLNVVSVVAGIGGLVCLVISYSE